MRVVPRTLLALTGLLIVTLLLSGYDQGEAAPSDSTQSPSPSAIYPTSPPPGGGDFYMWEQQRNLTGETQDIARTIHAWEYFSALNGRYAGYADPRWQLVASDQFWDITGASEDPVYWRSISRGPYTQRLMVVRVKGDTAYTMACVDLRRVETAQRGTNDWSDLTPAIAGAHAVLHRSQQSPTGWYVSTIGGPDFDISRADCRRAFKNKQPSLIDVGEPDYIDTWPKPTQSPDAR